VHDKCACFQYNKAMQTETTPRPMTAHPCMNLQGTATVPGDKSISHRALIFASQAIGSTHIQGLLEGEDVISTMRALQSMGARITKNESGEWQVQGVGIGGLQEPDDVLNMGNAGTAARLLMGLVAPYAFNSFFTGDASLRSRPMQRVMTPLEQMGISFLSREGGRLPLVVRGNRQPLPIHYDSPVASAQVKSAILLAALNIPGTTSITEPALSRDHTERMLQDFGVDVRTTRHKDGRVTVTLNGQPEIIVKNKKLTVPADPSSAAFLVVAALVTPDSQLTLPNVNLNPARIGLFDTLKEMGAKIRFTNKRESGGEPMSDIVVKASRLKGVTVPAERAPSMIDEYPILSIAAACAQGTTVMQGLAELRVKESDRLQAIENMLKCNGISVTAKKDKLTVKGNGKPPKGGGTVMTSMDHRIAMSGLILGLASNRPVTVDDVRCIETSFPGFVPMMQSLGAVIEVPKEAEILEIPPLPKRQNVPALIIAIDGPAASGKGTLARRLASYFGFTYLDTGSLYRAVGLKLVYDGTDPHDEAAAIQAASGLVAEDLVNPRLRQERVGNAASIVSAMPEVRAALLDFQREFAKREGGAVLDGRDVGTVVCPNADMKFFVTADMETRAGRRHKELQGFGVEVVYDSVLADLKERDQRDSERATAPLKPAEDAITIDTSNMNINDVFEKAVAMIHARFAETKQKRA
jgi:3-phosphoshikimate 1-carboxyvinyltransferase